MCVGGGRGSLAWELGLDLHPCFPEPTEPGPQALLSVPRDPGVM